MELIVPTVAFPPCTEFTCQVTAELQAFCTITLNCTGAPAKGCAEPGVTLTLTAGGGSETMLPHELQIIATMNSCKKIKPRILHAGAQGGNESLLSNDG